MSPALVARSLVALFALIVQVGSVRADELPPDCGDALALAVPVKDLPDAGDRLALRGCDSEALYYGIGVAKDDAAARKCALIEAESPDPNPGIFGAGVLMMIYANGRGVPRDLGLARKFACAMWSAPAELSGRLAHLRQLAEANDAGSPLDVCDDITSGVMGGFCAGREERRASVGRTAALSALQANWSAEQREAFRALRRAADGYFKASTNNEVDLSGTLRGAFMTEHEAALEGELLSMLRDFEAGRLPQGDAASYAADDRALNAVYVQVMKAAVHPAGQAWGPFGTIEPAGIRTAEIAWLRYRDAWAAFGAIRYPSVAKPAWLGYLTRQRTKALKALMGDP